MKDYSDQWLKTWCHLELLKCQRTRGVTSCPWCSEYGECQNDPLRVMRRILAKKEPIIVKVSQNRFDLVL